MTKSITLFIASVASDTKGQDEYGRVGWAMAHVSPDELTLFECRAGRKEHATVNQAALQALREALTYSLGEMLSAECNLDIFSDNQYIVNGVQWINAWESNNWNTKEGKPVSNKAMWQEYIRLSHLVKAHLSVTKTSELGYSSGTVRSIAQSMLQAKSKEEEQVKHSFITISEWEERLPDKIQDEIAHSDSGKRITYKPAEGAVRVCQLLVEAFPEEGKNPQTTTDWFNMNAAHELALKVLEEEDAQIGE